MEEGDIHGCPSSVTGKGQASADMVDSRRIAKWDNAKLLLILLVVLGHLCDYYTADHPLLQGLFVFIYSFHMPLFILIVGLFAKRICTSRRFPASRIFGYLMLGLLCEALIFVVRYICWHDHSFTVIDQDALSWFLVACAAYIGVTWLFREVRFGHLFVFALLLGILVGYDSQVNDTLALSRIIVYYPFFLVGYRLDPSKLADAASKPLSRVLALIVVVAFGFICLLNIGDVTSLRLLFTAHNPFAMTPGYGAPQRILCYLISGVMCWAVMCLVPRRRLPLISDAGTRTLAVYILHVPLIFLLIRGHVSDFLVGTMPTLGLAAWLSLCVPITALLSIPVFDKPFRWALDCAARPRSYNDGRPQVGFDADEEAGRGVPLRFAKLRASSDVLKAFFAGEPRTDKEDEEAHGPDE